MMSSEPAPTLEAWAPHRQLSLAQARARTQTVKYIRFGLVAAAVVTLAVFFGYILGSAYERSGASASTLNADETVTMKNPRFTGRDGASNLYVITADSAQQRRENQALVDLVNPKLLDSFDREVTAPRGLYDRANETLDLYDDVLVVDERGYVFNSTHARVFPETGLVIGVEPLDGTGPLGDIRSDSYELEREAGIVTFKGNVVTDIYEDTTQETEEEDPLP